MSAAGNGDAMRVLHVIHQYAPHHVGGTEIYTQSLAKALAACGHAVAIFTRVMEANAAGCLTTDVDDTGVTVYRWWCAEPKGVYNLFRDSYANREALRPFAAVLQQFKPDIVHIQHLKGLHHNIPQLAVRAGARVVVTLHDYWYFCGNAQLLRPNGHVCGGPRWWLNCADCAAHRAQEPALMFGAPIIAGLFAERSRRLAQALQQANVIIAPSRAVYDTYARQMDMATRMRIIEHGIDAMPDADAPIVPAVGPLRILFAGGLSWQKGVHVLLAAFRALPSGSATLDICGDEHTFPQYVAQLKAAARGLAVTFHGAVPHERLAKMMRQSDVLAIPSLWPETASLVALEAQAVGLPIIASDVGALRERVASAAEGWLVAAGDVGAWGEALGRLA
ncbi:MAG: glycosyltransferase family 4 protein, partial [Chloroflexota bacterium]